MALTDAATVSGVAPEADGTSVREPAAVPAGRRGRLSGGRAWDVAAILVSWFGGLLLIGDAATVRGLSDDAVFLHFVAGCAVSLALWWRRSHPMGVAIFLLAASVVTDGAGIAALIGLYTVISLRRGRPVVVLILFQLVGGIAYSLIYPDPTLSPAESSVVSFVLTVAILAATVALGVAARSRRELIESLRERATRAEAEAHLRAEQQRARERERIAREMHDALAHRISMVSLHAGALQIRPDLTPEEVAKAAATIRDSAHHALEDLREILGVLRAGPADARRPQPDVSHLSELLADARAAGLTVTAANRLDGLRLSASLGRTIYRLVQEGLTNAGKHAPGSPVTLLLDQTPGGDLHVHVSNPLPPVNRPSTVGGRPGSRPSRMPDANGGAPQVGWSSEPNGDVPVGGGGLGTAVPGAGSGLLGLTERVELLGGRMRYGVRGDPRAGLTFDLEAWVPWPTPSGS
ncbi:sensor histidine kinase [Actinoplanes sichuanensis]|uniref:histidine kinase n=1 Tax=Actinoplanes sichuanensis TaxID=512349 RepID=A0ABW4AGN5_9ACTN|nr:histidine kinase [Actinoplanes sichuanensis]